jgi:hypothetical protein
MKRITLLTVLVACGLIAASTPVFAQATTESSNWFTGKVNLLLLGREDVDSSKFQEYREVPKGVSMPVFTLMGSNKGTDFALLGRNVSQSDQRYTGWATFSWVGISFDYNSIPHNMGNDGRTIHTETAPGVWSMSQTLRGALGAAVDATPTASRNYTFYAPLLAPTIASAGSYDISGLRQRGDVTFDLGGNTPFDLTFTYLRELKTGARGASGGDVLGVVTAAVDVLEPMDEVTQDFGVRFAYTFKAGDVHATFNRNIYNDRIDSLVIDNPFRATDLAYTSTAVPGGPAQTRFSASPDNEASRGAFGFLFKAKRQTRIAGEVALGTWTQDAQFLPFTINTAIFTPTGASAASSSTLPQQSLNGKINTTSFNFAFSSRPVNELAIRLRYRGYELTNETTPVAWTGSTSGSPDRTWGAPPTGGWATSVLYDNST